MNPDECGHTSDLDYAGRCRECLEDLIDLYADEEGRKES